MLLILLLFCIYLFVLYTSVHSLVTSVAYVYEFSILDSFFGCFYSWLSGLFSYVGPNKLTTESSVEQLSGISNPWGRLLSEIKYLYNVVSNF